MIVVLSKDKVQFVLLNLETIKQSVLLNFKK